MFKGYCFKTQEEKATNSAIVSQMGHLVKKPARLQTVRRFLSIPFIRNFSIIFTDLPNLIHWSWTLGQMLRRLLQEGKSSCLPWLRACSRWLITLKPKGGKYYFADFVPTKNSFFNEKTTSEMWVALQAACWLQNLAFWLQRGGRGGVQTFRAGLDLTCPLQYIDV